MAKRFTDTAKWDKPWYRKLGCQGRDIWNWLYDNCEPCGAWEIDIERMSFDLGFEVSLSKILEVMRGAQEIGDNKLFFPGFIQFQYGTLSEDCKPHQAIIRRLKSLNLWKGYAKGCLTLEEKEKDKEQEKVKGESEGKIKSAEDLVSLLPEEIRKLYDDEGYVTRESIKAWAWCKDNPRKTPKSAKGFRRFFSGWLDRGWETYRKSIPSNRQSSGNPAGTNWELLAKRVLDAIVKAGSGSNAAAEREHALGPDLHAIAIKAGIQNIRNVPRGDFQLRTLAGMLQRASEITGAA